MAELGTKLDTKLNTKTRLETLYYFVYEMAQSFGVYDDDLDSITKGILQRRILSQITVNYKNSDDVIVGRVTIKIDWDKHTLLASTDYGSTFTLDPAKSIRSQISEVSDIIIEHVNNMQRDLKIKKVDTTFRYLSQDDPIKLQEDMKYLGHVFATSDIKISIQKEFTSSIEWLCGKLNEVKIITENS
ncbi:MAG: hypothetical protein ACLSVG_08590 [Clostridia bacterium]